MNELAHSGLLTGEGSGHQALPKVGGPRLPVSVIIMTKNEQRVLPHTLASVTDFDQVFVVDSQSTDSTRQIAEDHGAAVVTFTWDGAYPKKKEWCLLNLSFAHDWVLYLDADEVVTPGLSDEIRSLVCGGGSIVESAFDVELDYYFLGRRLRHGYKVTKRVLLRRRDIEWPRVDDLGVTNMWEVEGHYQPTVHGAVGRLRSRLEHHDRDPLYDYFARHNRYSDWEAAMRRNAAGAGPAGRSAKGRIWSRVPFKPLAFFLYAFVAKAGFRDGSAGFHYALANSFYYWQIRLKERELAQVVP
jgi:glycosyltransferase involved in cell wall biosynthesis